jgi:myb proto-oncogene protein
VIAIAALVPGRTNFQCRQRWATLFYSTIEGTTTRVKGKRWTPEEDAILIDVVKKLGEDWVAVAALVPGRTDVQCCQRWEKSLDPDVNKGEWIPEEDAKLTEAVAELGHKSWPAVAALVPGRTTRQCRERWATCLDPTVEHMMGKMTPEEDAKLIEAVMEHGKDWVRVAAMLPGRTNGQCRQRWAARLNPTVDRTCWKPEEDAKLTEAVTEHGENNWVAVAEFFPSRTKVSCRKRWRFMGRQRTQS